MNPGVAVESIVAGLLGLSGYWGWRILNGYIKTRKYVPDIIEGYKNKALLQRKVSFGTTSRRMHWLLSACCIVLTGAVYYWIRMGGFGGDGS